MAWRRLDDVPGGPDARPWLFGVARNVLANYYRSERRRTALGVRLRETLIADLPSAVVEPSTLGTAMALLSEDDRELLRLVAWEGLARDEIALVLRVPRAAVRVRLHRARRRLLLLMAQVDGAEHGTCSRSTETVGRSWTCDEQTGRRPDCSGGDLMRDQDVMRQLAALNPVTNTDLARLDAAAGAALREGIVMTKDSPAPTRLHRLGRRSVLAGGLTVALLGGGLAYAAVHNDSYEHSGGFDGLTCLSAWADPNQVSLDEAGIATGGAALSGDPVADCQHYQELSGRPPIDDPVAFQWDGPSVYVAPRAQVPPDVTLLVLQADAGPVHELSLSLDDLVGGLGASCLSTDDAVVDAQAELDRLGLTDWEVTGPPAEVTSAGPRRSLRDSAARQTPPSPGRRGGPARSRARARGCPRGALSHGRRRHVRLQRPDGAGDPRDPGASSSAPTACSDRCARAPSDHCEQGRAVTRVRPAGRPGLTAATVVELDGQFLKT